MKNTGITYTSAERSPVILPEMAELLPPLSAEQSAALEEDLLRNGCYSPVIVNEDMVIVDGHNRQALCEKHGLPYTMAVFSFEDLLEAKQWALDTQKGRRNLEKWELGKIALKLKPEMVHISMPRKLVLKLAMELSCSVVRPVSTPLARPAWIASIRPVWAAAPLAAMPSAVQAALMASLGMPRMYCTGR